MFRTTSLGWQGWLVESERGALLIDPLLVDEAGRGPAGTRQTFFFWPPRRWAWDRFPRVSAVFLSHEHEDHFNVASLSRIERSVPVFLSARSSLAARKVIEEMGFALHLVYPDETSRIGDLELTVFSPDHLFESGSDEWDTLGYLVRDVGGNGAFFSNVDVAITTAMREAIRALPANEDGSPTDCVAFVQGNVMLCRGSLPPGLGTVKGPARLASFDEEHACEVLAREEPVRPHPGQVFELSRGHLNGVPPRSEFLWTPPRSAWGDPEPTEPDPKAPLVPVCGRRAMADDEAQELEDGLARIAEHLYGRDLFCRLHSLSRSSLEGRRPTFLWLLLDGDVEGDAGTLAVEYAPEACAFLPVDDVEGSVERYAGVVCCWATDLLAVIRGEMEPRSITKAWRESWAGPLARTTFLSSVVWMFFHPLRQPEACLRQYRKCIESEREAALCVKHRGKG